MVVKRMNKKKISILASIILVVFGISGFMYYQYEQNRELSLQETKELKPYLIEQDFSSNKAGVMTIHYQLDSMVREYKQKKMDYYVYNSKTQEFTDLIQVKNELTYIFDLKTFAQNRIDKFVNTGAGQYPYDSERFETLLEEELKDEELYLMALPKGYASEKNLYDASESELLAFAKKNSFDTTSINFLLSANQARDGYKGGYSTVSEYVVSLITKELSPEDFAYLVTKVRSHVPRPVEIYNAVPVEGQVSKRLEKDYFARGNFDYRKTSYVLAEFLQLPVYSREVEYLRTYSVAENEKEALEDNIKEWNQRIIDDKKKYEEDSTKVFLDEDIQEIGVIDNALFSFRLNEDKSQWLQLSVDKADEY